MKQEKNKLEQFIEDNKNNFDSEFISTDSWKKIESEISKPKRNRQPIWMVAASIILLLSVGWLAYDRAQLTTKINELENLSINNRPYSEIENFYQQSINEKTMLVNQISRNRNIDINSDLKTLNKKYEGLKVKAKEHGAPPQLVNAMIQNLQTQINILEQQLNILQDLQEYSQNDKNENNEISI